MQPLPCQPSAAPRDLGMPLWDTPGQSEGMLYVDVRGSRCDSLVSYYLLCVQHRQVPGPARQTYRQRNLGLPILGSGTTPWMCGNGPRRCHSRHAMLIFLFRGDHHHYAGNASLVIHATLASALATVSVLRQPHQSLRGPRNIILCMEPGTCRPILSLLRQMNVL